MIIQANIQEALHSLNEAQPFAFFNLCLTEQEQAILKEMHIHHAIHNDYFGNTDYLKNELSVYLQSIIKNSDWLAIVNITMKLIQQCMLVTEKNLAWIALRSTLATHTFDKPRWHTDGYYYPPYKGFQYKFVFVMQGLSTLFCQIPSNLRGKFNALQYETMHRQRLIELLAPFTAQSASFNQGAVFIAGPNEIAAIHSEPPIHEPRLFLSVVTGNQKQMDEVKNINNNL